MKFVVDYFGCRSNQAEVQEWIIELEKRGYELTSAPAEADFGILNTCSVTAKAEKDVLRFIGKTYRNTNAKWFIVGCTVTQDKASLSQKYKNYFFFDNLEKKQLVTAVSEIFPADLSFLIQIADFFKSPGRLQFPLFLLPGAVPARQSAEPAKKGNRGQGQALRLPGIPGGGFDRHQPLCIRL
jgi:tRNA A37 methylthiotransferase MiaB